MVHTFLVLTMVYLINDEVIFISMYDDIYDVYAYFLQILFKLVHISII